MARAGRRAATRLIDGLLLRAWLAKEHGNAPMRGLLVAASHIPFHLRPRLLMLRWLLITSYCINQLKPISSATLFGERRMRTASYIVVLGVFQSDRDVQRIYSKRRCDKIVSIQLFCSSSEHMDKDCCHHSRRYSRDVGDVGQCCGA